MTSWGEEGNLVPWVLKKQAAASVRIASFIVPLEKVPVLPHTASSASASWHPKHEVRLEKDGRFLESKAQQDFIIKYL